MNAMTSALSTLVRTGLLATVVVLVVPPQRVSAQEMDHSQMQIPMPMPMDMPIPVNKPAATEPAQKKTTKKPVKKSKPASHDTQTTPPGAPASPATQGMDHAAMGHDMPMPAAAPQAVPIDHSTMDMRMDHSGMPGMSMAPTGPIMPIPELTAADRAAAVPPPSDHPVHDNTIQSYVLFDRLETWNADQGTGLEWEGQAWIGTDLDRLWLRSEGERVAGQTESANLEVLYGRSVAAWWDVVAGVRHDFKPGGAQDFAAIGVMGLAPYKFEVAATAYLGQGGQTAGRIEVEYETLLTNRLILQPLVEVNLYGRDDPRRGIGSGLSTVEASLRLRYEFTRRFAPYIGIIRERAFGGTADLRRAHNDVDDIRFVTGLRLWF